MHVPGAASKVNNSLLPVHSSDPSRVHNSDPSRTPYAQATAQPLKCTTACCGVKKLVCGEAAAGAAWNGDGRPACSLAMRLASSCAAARRLVALICAT